MADYGYYGDGSESSDANAGRDMSGGSGGSGADIGYGGGGQLNDLAQNAGFDIGYGGGGNLNQNMGFGGAGGDIGYGGGGNLNQNMGFGGAGGGDIGYGGGGGNLNQNMGFGGAGGYGMGASSGNASGYGPPPSQIGNTFDAPAIQSAQQMSAPGALTAGAVRKDDQQVGPGGELSGKEPSMMARLMSVLGGGSPVSSASAAEKPQMIGSPDTLTTDDRTINTSGLTDFAAAPSSITPIGGIDYLANQGANQTTDPTLGSIGGIDYTKIPSNEAEANQAISDTLGRANTPGLTGLGDQFPGRFSGTASDATGNLASRLGDMTSGIGGAASGGPTLADRFANVPAGQATDLQASRINRDTKGDPGFVYQPTDQSGKGDQLPYGVVPDTTTNLALQGVDSPPPGGNLTGGGGPFDQGAFTGAGPPGTFAGGAPPVPGTTANTATPPVPGSPADTETPIGGGVGSTLADLQRSLQNSLDPTRTFTDPRQADFTGSRYDTGPYQTGDETAGIPLPRPAPGAPADTASNVPEGPGRALPFAPQQTGGGGAGQQFPTGAGQGAPVSGGAGGAGGAIDARGQGSNDWRGRQASIKGAISNVFGGGKLGDTVANLMAYLGIPAALIFAATRGGGGRMGLVGGQNAMSGAGRIGGFQPNFSRSLFPGPGLPALAGLGIAGALAGNKLANPAQKQQPPQDHPPVVPGRPPSAPETPPARPTEYTTPRGSGPGSVNMPMPVPHEGAPAATPDQAPIEASLGPGGMSGYTGAVFGIESSNDPNNVTGKNYGLGQFSIGEYGITAQNWRDPRAQQRAMQLETAQNIPRLRQVMGRDPTPAELYIAHQQGPAGGPALLAAAQSNPNTPAWQVISRFYGSPAAAARAIGENLTDNLKGMPVQNITAGQFVESWKARFNRAYIPYIRRQQQQAALQ